jgi:tight adherence protein B
MIIIVITIIFFIATLLIIEAGFYAYRAIRYPHRDRIREKLRSFRDEEEETVAVPDFLRKRVLSEVPLINALLQRWPITVGLGLLLKQANAKLPLGFFILLTPVLALTAYVISDHVTKNFFFSVFTCILFGIQPYLYLRVKKSKRMQQFEKQIPEGLELIARALRAGHAFTSGMKLAADELGDPFGTEFQETIEEINFGLSVPDALRDLVKRVDCPDLKFFVIAATIQRETGGNLAEIIENISRIIRERFKLYGKIRSLSAEARISSLFMSILPFVVMIVLFFINPEYIKTLFSDPVGQKIVAVAGFLLLTGIFMIHKMARIKV